MATAGRLNLAVRPGTMSAYGPPQAVSMQLRNRNTTLSRETQEDQGIQRRTVLEILQSEGLPNLVERCRSGTDAEKERAAATLAFCASNDLQAKMRIVSAGGLPPLIAMLSAEDGAGDGIDDDGDESTENYDMKEQARQTRSPVQRMPPAQPTARPSAGGEDNVRAVQQLPVEPAPGGRARRHPASRQDPHREDPGTHPSAPAPHRAHVPRPAPLTSRPPTSHAQQEKGSQVGVPWSIKEAAVDTLGLLSLELAGGLSQEILHAEGGVPKLLAVSNDPDCSGSCRAAVHTALRNLATCARSLRAAASTIAPCLHPHGHACHDLP